MPNIGREGLGESIHLLEELPRQRTARVLVVFGDVPEEREQRE
jgi:hypothetical protein